MTRIVAGDPGAEEVVVYLDGELLEWCIEADDVEGYVLAHESAFDWLAFKEPAKRQGRVEFRPGSFDKQPCIKVEISD